MRCSPFFMTHTVLEWHGSTILTSIWEVYILYCRFIIYIYMGQKIGYPHVQQIPTCPFFKMAFLMWRHLPFSGTQLSYSNILNLVRYIPRIIPFNRTKSDGNVRFVRATQREVSVVPEFPRPHRPGSDGSEMIGDIVGNGIVYTLISDIYIYMIYIYMIYIYIYIHMCVIQYVTK